MIVKKAATPNCVAEGALKILAAPVTFRTVSVVPAVNTCIKLTLDKMLAVVEPNLPARPGTAVPLTRRSNAVSPPEVVAYPKIT